MKKILVSGPLLSLSGYGKMCRLAVESLQQHQDKFDIYVNLTTWGQTGFQFKRDEYFHLIQEFRVKTEQYIKAGGQFDVSLQITIPNEWKRMAPINIGYTAGIETHVMSPAWLEPCNMMDKIVTISEFAKNVIVTTVFGDQQGNQHHVHTPVEVVHFPLEQTEAAKGTFQFPSDFNFLTVNQWGPRKNMEFLVRAFVDEFRNEDVGLVIKTNAANDSIMDRSDVERRLKELLDTCGTKKCRVHLVHGRLSENEMAGLYRNDKVKAFVTATHGEGFGIPIFEAVAAELPVVATDWSGHLDFLTMPDEQGKDKKMFAKVDFELKQIDPSHVWPGVMEAQSGWAFPTVGSLRSRMREVYKDQGRFNSWAKKLAAYNKERFDSKKIKLDFIEQIIGERPIDVSLEEIPKISIITSVFKGDEYIRSFLQDITRQTIFKEKCELILINAASPGNEEEIINEYIKEYPDNIIYKRLDNDPGIYACWNIGVNLATGEFLTNANLDDRKSPNSLEKHAKALLKSDSDLVYSDSYIVHEANKKWEDINNSTQRYNTEQFSAKAMLRGNLPHNNPMWKKKLHEGNRMFSEKYRSAGDWDFWLSCVVNGAKFTKINEVLGIYYFNPKGISTNFENFSWKQKEEEEIYQKYLKILG
jgi:hypothetical protein